MDGAGLPFQLVIHTLKLQFFVEFLLYLNIYKIQHLYYSFKRNGYNTEFFL